MRIAAVFFDVDFTLIHPGPTFLAEGYQRFCARYDIEVDPARFADATAAAASLLGGPEDAGCSDRLVVGARLHEAASEHLLGRAAAGGRRAGGGRDGRRQPAARRRGRDARGHARRPAASERRAGGARRGARCPGDTIAARFAAALGARVRGVAKLRRRATLSGSPGEAESLALHVLPRVCFEDFAPRCPSPTAISRRSGSSPASSSWSARSGALATTRSSRRRSSPSPSGAAGF